MSTEWLKRLISRWCGLFWWSRQFICGRPNQGIDQVQRMSGTYSKYKFRLVPNQQWQQKYTFIKFGKESCTGIHGIWTHKGQMRFQKTTRHAKLPSVLGAHLVRVCPICYWLAVTDYFSYLTVYIWCHRVWSYIHPGQDQLALTLAQQTTAKSQDRKNVKATPILLHTHFTLLSHESFSCTVYLIIIWYMYVSLLRWPQLSWKRS